MFCYAAVMLTYVMLSYKNSLIRKYFFKCYNFLKDYGTWRMEQTTSNLSALREWEDHARNNAWLLPLTIFILGYIILFYSFIRMMVNSLR